MICAHPSFCSCSQNNWSPKPKSCAVQKLNISVPGYKGAVAFNTCSQQPGLKEQGGANLDKPARLGQRPSGES